VVGSHFPDASVDIEGRNRKMAAQSHNRRIRCLCVLVCGCTTATGASAYEIHVYQGQSIQAAIDWVTEGDEIIVHPGTYYEAIDLLGKAITVRSINPEDPAVVQSTIINGAGAYHVVQCSSGETPATVVAGFTITGGNANGHPWDDAYGGGVSFWNSSSPTLMNCLIIDNQAAFGGGVSCRMASNPTLANCTISNNLVFWAHGGGVYCLDNSSPTLTNCRISDNTAPLYGGGVCSDGCNPTLTNCTIIRNSAGEGGGVLGGGTLTNCTFSGNSADEGGAVYGGCTLANCVLWGDLGGEVAGSTTATYCDVQGGWDGQGNIDADPLFVDAEDGDLHLSAGSPCIDAANNEAVPPDTFDLDGDDDTTEPIPFDLDGNPRFVDDPDTQDTGIGDPPLVDMGAYEYQASPCPADFDDDGDVDTADLLFLLSAWGTGDGDVDGDGDTDTADLLALLSAWGDCP
jgi:parallel beta-helix repeat protein/predicted outer membrane repeat protein